MTGADQRWREQALCAQTDSELFFPPKGGSTRAARRVCAACQVRTECLADALACRDVEFGVRAGTTPRQRRAMLRASTRPSRAA